MAESPLYNIARKQMGIRINQLYERWLGTEQGSKYRWSRGELHDSRPEQHGFELPEYIREMQDCFVRADYAGVERIYSQHWESRKNKR